MSKRDWYNPDDLIVVQPNSVDDFMARKDDLNAIYGDGDPDPELWDWHPEHYYNSFWLFYLKQGDDLIPVGLIRWEYFTRSVVMHGECREEYRGKGIEHYAALAGFNYMFLKIGYTKISIPVPDENAYARGFARRWGFEKTGHREGDVTYWRLKRDKFMRTFLDGQQISTEGESGHSA